MIYQTIRSAYIGFGAEQIVFILFLDCFLCFFAVALFALAQASASHSHIKQNYDDKFIYLLLAMCAMVCEREREGMRVRGSVCECVYLFGCPLIWLTQKPGPSKYLI